MLILNKAENVNMFDYYERDTQGSINSDFIKISSQKIASSCAKLARNGASKVPSIQCLTSQIDENIDIADIFHTSSNNNQGCVGLDEQGTLKTTSSDSKNGRQINIDLDDDKIENVVCLPKKSNKYRIQHKFCASQQQKMTPINGRLKRFF